MRVHLCRAFGLGVVDMVLFMKEMCVDVRMFALGQKMSWFSCLELLRFCVPRNVGDEEDVCVCVCVCVCGCCVCVLSKCVRACEFTECVCVCGIDSIHGEHVHFFFLVDSLRVAKARVKTHTHACKTHAERNLVPRCCGREAGDGRERGG